MTWTYLALLLGFGLLCWLILTGADWLLDKLFPGDPGDVLPGDEDR
jgi:hypothetical protein